jgi:hypothetical protein
MAEPLFRCPRCGESKPSEAFWKRATHVSGRSPYCRECGVAYHKEYRHTSRAHAIATRAIRQRLPERMKARHAVAYALKIGKLVRGPCEIGEGCDGGIEAHHDDYSQRLVVRWFCRRHHRQLDRQKFGRPRKIPA